MVGFAPHIPSSALTIFVSLFILTFTGDNHESSSSFCHARAGPPAYELFLFEDVWMADADPRRGDGWFCPGQPNCYRRNRAADNSRRHQWWILPEDGRSGFPCSVCRDQRRYDL